MRLIDADTKLTVLMFDEEREEWFTEEMTVDDLISKFADETPPTIDAVSVIRCKDCVHFKQSKVLGNTCALTDNHVTKKDYCSKAERKEE